MRLWIFQREIVSSGVPTITFKSEDEICSSHATTWSPANSDGVNFLDRECRKPRKLLVNYNCILRLTANIQDLTKGHVCSLAELPDRNDKSLLVYVAPAQECLLDNTFDSRIVQTVAQETHFEIQ